MQNPLGLHQALRSCRLLPIAQPLHHTSVRLSHALDDGNTGASSSEGMTKGLRGKRNAGPPSIRPDKLLHAAAVARFAGVDVALRVHRETMQRAEFTILAAVASCG